VTGRSLTLNMDAIALECRLSPLQKCDVRFGS
jgi:hypothetical protein